MMISNDELEVGIETDDQPMNNMMKISKEKYLQMMEKYMTRDKKIVKEICKKLDALPIGEITPYIDDLHMILDNMKNNVKMYVTTKNLNIPVVLFIDQNGSLIRQFVNDEPKKETKKKDKNVTSYIQ